MTWPRPLARIAIDKTKRRHLISDAAVRIY